MRNQNIRKKWLALLLCIAMFMEGISFSTFATTRQTAVSNQESQQTPSEADSSTAQISESETPERTDTILSNAESPDSSDSPNTDLDTPNSSGSQNTETDTPDSSASQESDSNTPDSSDSQETESNTPDSSDSQETESNTPDSSDSQDSDSNTPETSDAQNTESESLLPSETVTESTTEADTITEPTETESADTSEDEYDALLAEQIAAAESAFTQLLSEKDFMALLYRTNSYAVRGAPDLESSTVATIESGHTLYICGIVISDDAVWYQVRFGLDGAEKTGYVESEYLAYSDEDWISWEETHLAPLFAGSFTYGVTANFTTANSDTDFSASDSSLENHASERAVNMSDIAAFPAIYHANLRKLKEAHPNWLFVPMNTKIDFNTAVSNEMGAKSLIQNTSSNASKGWVGASCPTEKGWNYATQPAVAYYMNPTNFLTETYIFQFEQLTFNGSYHTEGAIQSFLNNTFMKGAIPGDSGRRTYAKAFFEIGKSRRLSPIHLASRVYQEQGAGNSALISGNYKGYEGYYNYFNVGASGGTTAAIIQSGLKYAKSKGWNTRYKSLSGGAATIGNGYVLKGQDTLYLQKFNVDGNYNPLYTHQYMQNIQAPASESSSTRRMYANAGSLNSPFVFKIPVYNNMPGASAGSPETPVVPVEPEIPQIPIESITLNKSSIALRRKDTISTDTTGMTEEEKKSNVSTATIKATIKPSDTTFDKTITWSSSNPKVASVKAGSGEQEFIITATGPGETTLTAKTVNNKTASVKVKVTTPMYKMELVNTNEPSGSSSGAATLFVGQRINLTAEYWPKDTTSDTTVTWSSSNPAVADVSKGTVTAYATGSTVISASVNHFQSSYQIHVDECNVSFMAEDGTTLLAETTIPFGKTVPESVFPEMESTDLRIFIGWFTKQGGKGLQFQPDTAIHSKQTTLYPYFEEQDKGFYVLPVGDQIFTGSAIKPTVRVFDGISYEDGSGEVIELVQGKDYTVSYKNNKNVNAEGSKNVPTITIKGKGNYAGTEYVRFNILSKPLTDSDITAENIQTAYSGNTQKKSPVVYRNGKKLAANKDYKVTYPQSGPGAYNSAGVYPIVITGKGGYTGKITVYQTITKNVMMSKVSVAKIPNQPYRNDLINKGTNSGIVPEKLTVTYKNKPLALSTDGGKTGDYTVTYKNNLAIGTATATLTAVEGSGFSGSKNVTYKITGTSISKAKVQGITNREYTGNEADVMQNNLVLTLNDKVLQPSTDNGITGDYTISYSKISKVGTATIVLKGINEYNGQIKKTYKITPCMLTLDGSINPVITMAYHTQAAPSQQKNIQSLSEITSPYMKGSTKPNVLLYRNGVPLTLGKDYTIKYSNNKAVTTIDTPEKKLPKITITGKGNFKGSISGFWQITDGQLSTPQINEEQAISNKVTMTVKDVVYKNKANSYKTTVTLTDANGSKLTAGKDYDKNLIYTYVHESVVNIKGGGTEKRAAGDLVTAVDIPSANTAIRVTAKGIGAYLGNGTASISRVYRIIAANLSTAKVKAAAKVYLNGKEIKLTKDDLNVTLNGSTLVYGQDYTIDESTYKNNIKKGKATVVLRGIGENYGGEKKITFTIAAKKVVWWKNLLQ